MYVPNFGVIGFSNSALQLDVDDGFYDSVTGSDFDNAGDETAAGDSLTVAIGAFYLFTSIPTLTGKTVNSAHLVMRTLAGDSGSATVKLKIMAEDVVSPVFPINAADARGAVRTTAKIDWDDIPFLGERELISPDLSSIINELIATHTTPTALLFFVDDDGSASNKNLQVFSRDEGNGKDVVLLMNIS